MGFLCVLMLVLRRLLSCHGRSAGDRWLGCDVTVSVGREEITLGSQGVEADGGLVSGVLLKRFLSAWW